MTLICLHRFTSLHFINQKRQKTHIVLFCHTAQIIRELLNSTVQNTQRILREAPLHLPLSGLIVLTVDNCHSHYDCFLFWVTHSPMEIMIIIDIAMTDVFCFVLLLSYVMLSIKPEMHWANWWLSEAFRETWMSSRTNLFGVFSCVGSFWNCADSVCSSSTCKVWEGWLLPVWAIGFSDWCQLYDNSYQCASKSARCVGGAEYCVRFVFLCALFCHFLFSCFLSTGTRLAPPAVKEAYCILRKCITSMLLGSWHYIEALCLMQLLCRMVQMRGNGVVE